MSVASNGDLINTLFAATKINVDQIVDDALLFPLAKFERVVVNPNFSYDRYKYEIRIGPTKALLIFFININFTGSAGTNLYFSIPEANGKLSFFMQVSSRFNIDQKIGHPPQSGLHSQGNVYQRVLSGTPENNGVAALKTVAPGNITNNALAAFVMFDF